MINKPKGYEEASVYTDRTRLPAGGYELVILDAKVDQLSWGQILVIRFDVASGEYKDFYNDDYLAQGDNKKWKGTFRIILPSDDGTEQDSYKIRNLKTAIAAIEDSNSNFTWDWDERKLKGNVVGGLFGNNEYEFNGYTGFYTACRRFVDIQKIKESNFKIPQDKLLDKNQNQNNTIPAGFEELNDAELPF